MLYAWGISIDPGKVIVGRDGWLYLGDKYGATLTVARRGKTADDVTLARQIGKSASDWERWLAQEGVRIYRVMVAPDKTTAYPEFLPGWARPATPSAMDALFDEGGNGIYVDLRQELANAKSRYSEPLYYRTDTHWNDLGAAQAFHAFAEQVRGTERALRWPQEQDIRIQVIGRRKGGDLARFLRINEYLDDTEPVLSNSFENRIETVEVDFESSRLLRSGGNRKIETPRTALRIVSDQALNKCRVLWLRDSFGNALSPLMAITFSDTVQLHYDDAFANGGRRLVDLVKSWRPDYVFVTVVERHSRAMVFTTGPPVGEK